MVETISFVARCFLSDEWEEQIESALHRLGMHLSASRVTLFEKTERDAPVFVRRYEWSAPSTLPRSEEDFLAFDLNQTDLAAWVEPLSQGQLVAFNVADLPAPARRGLSDMGIVSLANVPIFVNGAWWGYLGLDDNERERDWSDQLETLRLCADLLGSGIARGRANRALRESEAELRALLGLMNDAIFVITGGGVYEKVLTSNPDILARPADELLGRALPAIFEEEIAQRFQSVIESALNARTAAFFEYALFIGGRELWFEATVTPLGEERVVWVARDITRARRDEQSLRESEQLFRLLAENSTDAISRLSPDFQTLYVSPSIQNIIGYAPHELVGTYPLQTVHPDDLPLMKAAYEEALSDTSKVATVTYRRRHRDGHWVWCETTGRAIVGASGRVEEFQVITRDVSARKQVEEQLRDAEARYRSIFENAVEGIFQTTPEGRYLAANPSLARIYGFDSPQELMATNVDIARDLYIEDGKRSEFVRLMQENGKVSNFEAQIKRRDGSAIWVSENARAVRDENGDLLYYEGTVEDITARKQAQDQLLHDALHDRLTGLANRALFSDRLGRAFARLKRHPTPLFAVLFLDFDRFKTVNDSLGHLAGDQLLVSIARRLEGCLRPGDTVSRLGGDEFALLLEDVRDQRDAIIVAERVQKAMKAPFKLAGQEVFSSASIGIALAHADYQNPEDLLRDADMAMYRAKSLGKARHEVFDSGMHTRAVALLQLETDLRWAIERREFELWYQPLVSLSTLEVTGFEALLRWQHAERGFISPAEFIPIAEETGWIVPLGAWALETACEQLAKWHEGGASELCMSVNLSGKQFGQADLTSMVAAQLDRWRLPAHCIHLEITESAILENAQAVTQRLLDLRALGVRLALDDFGTGYSSLSYLHRFPLDTLKIDRSFVMRLTEGDNREIVRTIIALGRNLRLGVVAEGIENELQRDELRSLGCTGGQGFLFSRPVPAQVAGQMIGQRF